MWPIPADGVPGFGSIDRFPVLARIHSCLLSLPPGSAPRDSANIRIVISLSRENCTRPGRFYRIVFARYPRPENTVAWVNAWPPGRSLIDRQLMSQCGDLDLQGHARTEQSGYERDERTHDGLHDSRSSGPSERSRRSLMWVSPGDQENQRLPIFGKLKRISASVDRLPLTDNATNPTRSLISRTRIWRKAITA